MNVIQQRAYHESLQTDLERAYKSLSVLFAESLDSALDQEGKVIDETSMIAHRRYSQAIQELGSALESLDSAKGAI